MNMYDLLNIDLKKVQDSDFIKFLRLEMPIRNGFGTFRFGRVRYALNGDQHEQENGLPIDLGKGIFTATLEDDELGIIKREETRKNIEKSGIRDNPYCSEGIRPTYCSQEYIERLYLSEV